MSAIRSLSRAEICNGTGFDRAARFVEEPVARQLADALKQIISVYSELTTGVLDIETALSSNEWHQALDLGEVALAKAGRLS